MPITDFSTGFSWISGFYSRTSTILKSADQPLLCHVTFRDNLIASKSALALHTDARAKREFSLLDAEREKRVYMRTGCSCTYVANQDDDTSNCTFSVLFSRNFKINELNPFDQGLDQIFVKTQRIGRMPK